MQDMKWKDGIRKNKMKSLLIIGILLFSTSAIAEDLKTIYSLNCYSYSGRVLTKNQGIFKFSRTDNSLIVKTIQGQEIILINSSCILTSVVNKQSIKDANILYHRYMDNKDH